MSISVTGGHIQDTDKDLYRVERSSLLFWVWIKIVNIWKPRFLFFTYNITKKIKHYWVFKIVCSKCHPTFNTHWQCRFLKFSFSFFNNLWTKASTPPPSHHPTTHQWTCSTVSGVWNKKICKPFTMQRNELTKLQFYLYR